MSEKLELAVNALNDRLAARARNNLLSPGLDEKRPQSWCEFGWPTDISFDHLYRLFRRGGVAHGVVKKLVSTCWKTNPWVIEGDDQDGAKNETTWEKSAKPVLGNARTWSAFAEADQRRLVGRYSALLIHVKDGKAWDQPVTGKHGIEKLTPAWANSLQASDFETSPDSAQYGMPKFWQYSEARVGGAGGRQLKIHPDRIFILGDWTDDAIGFLEPPYNAFANIEKVEGGSGESFLKNAARQLGVNFDKEVDLREVASMYGVTVDELQSRFNEAAREVNRGNDLMLITQGAAVSPLVSPIADPGPTYNINIQTIAAATDIPSKIIVGMQTGERASTEDQKYFNARCQSRRVVELSHDIHDFIAHLQRIKAVDNVSEFTVMWDDLTEATLSERLDNAKKMSDINNVAMASGEAVFDGDEIREVAGYDAMHDAGFGEEDGPGADSSE